MLRRLLPGLCLLAPALGAKCDTGWTHFTLEGDYCYYLNTDTLTWWGARSACQAYGGELTSIHHADTNTLLYGLCTTRRCHMGVNDISSERGSSRESWDWSDGTTYDYERWSTGEPNNCCTGSVPDGEDCGEFWANGDSAYWNDMPCNGEFGNYYPSLCRVDAGCDEGLYKDTNGDCQPCPTGRYRASAGAVGEDDCTYCPAGTYGSATGLSTQDCSGDCSAGHYCPSGSTTATQTDCPAGTYGSTAGLGSSACSGPCAAGYYCGTEETSSTPSGQLCAAGRYGGDGQSDSQCSGPCAGGYYCPEGSSTSQAVECGAVDRYCSSGSSTYSSVATGHYSTPTSDADATRSGQNECEAGYYCSGGKRYECPAGYYGSATGETSSACTGVCAAGYYCPSGSKSATAAACGSADVYCPEGSSTPQPVTSGWYSLPEDADEAQRESQAECPTDSICELGLRQLRLEFTSCLDQLEAPENTADAEVDPVVAWSNVDGAGASISYAFADPWDPSIALEAYYSLDDDGADESGATGRDGTISTSAGAASSTRKRGTGALYFDGAGDFMDFPVGGLLPAEGTVAAWVRPAGWGPGSGVAYGLLQSDFLSVFQWSSGLFYLRLGPTSNDLTFDNDDLGLLTDGVWTHLAVWWSQSADAMRIYANGQVVAERTGCDWSTSSWTGSVRLGQGADAYWMGYADDVAVYSTALKDVEVALAMSQVTTRLPTCPGLAANPMVIGGSSGLIAVGGEALNLEDCEGMTLTVEATWSGDTAFCAMPLTVIDINDPPDVEASVNREIEEKSKTNTNVGDPILASDPDFGQSIRFTLNMTKGDAPDLMFAIGACSGQLYVIDAGLDFIAKDLYELFVDVEDDGVPPLTDQGVAYVTVTNINDAPELDQSTVFAISENLPAGSATAPAAPTATDPDLDTLLWYITRNDDDAFAIDEATGALTNVVELNYETKGSYNVEIQVFDGELDERADFVIAVTDENDAPVVLSATVEVDEMTPAATSVGSEPVTATDEDGDTLTFSITAGNDDGTFAVDSATGQLSVALDQIDYEVASSYALTVTATDSGGSSGANTITVTVGDVNESPVITAAQTFSVPEDLAAGESVGTVASTDPDVGQTHFFDVAGSAFTTSSGGTLKVGTSGLDFEDATSHTVSVTVVDNGSPSLSHTEDVVVYVTDVNEAPEVTAQSLTIAENSVDVDLATAMIVTDPDAGDTHTWAVSANDYFEMNGAYLHALADANLDHEDVGSYSLTVTATDAGGLSGSAVITVTATDVNEAPVFADADRSVPEGSPQGTHVGLALEADDQDADDTLTYSIVSGNDLGYYALSSGGQLSVEASDWESNPVLGSTILLVRATDGAGLFDEGDVNVTIVDQNFFPELASQNFTIDEDAPENFIVAYDFGATDLDTAQTLTYSLQLRTLSDSNFDVSEAGAMTVGSLRLLDYETQPVHALLVAVTDDGPGALSTTATMYVHLNDVNEYPILSAASTARSVDENSDVGTSVGDPLVGADEDAADQGALTFSLLAADDVPLGIDAATGQLFTTGDIDYEEHDSFSFTVVLTDTAGLNSTGSVIVDVNDVNEPPVMDDLFLAIDENQAEGQSVGTLVATDPEREALAFFIVGGNVGGAFAVATGGNTLVVAGSLDYERTKEYVLDVSAFDGVSNTTVSVTVDVGNVNDVTVTGFVNGTAHSTAGGEVVLIAGTDFGEVAGDDAAVVSATYGPYTAANCFVVDGDNTQISCETVEGSGGALEWEVTVDSHTALDASALVSSYADPVVAAVLDAEALGTGGGESFRVQGDNFGPLGTPVSVAYDSFSATGCSVAEAHTEIACTSVEGYGAAFAWQVTADGLSSPLAVLEDTAFHAPEIAALSGTLLMHTTGGEMLTLTGSNFGPVEADAAATYVGSNGVTYSASACAVTVAHTAVECQTAPGVGYDHRWTLTIGGQASDASADVAAYYPPVISAVSGAGAENAVTAGGQLVTLTGEEFGLTTSIPAVTYGATGEEFEAAACAVRDDTHIVCETAVGHGRDHGWFATLGGQRSDLLQANTSYAQPMIMLYAGNGSVDASTAGGEVVVITGREFGSVAHNAIDFVTYSPAEFPDRVFYAQDCAVTVDHTEITCATGEGAGLELSWTIFIDGQESRVATTNYVVPTLLSVSHAFGDGALSTDGGQAVTLTGANFWTEPPQSVTYGSGYEAANCSILVPHEQIECFTVRGVGADLAWVVDILGQASTESDVTTAYQRPSVASLGPQDGDTDGGQTVTIVGADFGSDGEPRVNFNGVDLLPDLQDLLGPEDTLTFTAPAGAHGVDYPVVVSVGGQDSDVWFYTYANNAPVLPQLPERDVDENSAVGTLVGAPVAATDEDGASQTLTYALATLADTFAVDAGTGQLSVAGALDFETTSSYGVVLTVTDDGAPNLSDNCTVLVEINDLNERPTVEEGKATVAENAAVGALVGLPVNATDEDDGQLLSYTVEAEGVFDIAPLEAQLYVKSAVLDYETRSEYVVTVTVRDSAADPLEHSADVTISLLDLNEVPEITPASLTVVENTENSASVGSAIAVADQDAGDVVTYELVDDLGIFALASASDTQIRVANSSDLDHERFPTVTVTLVATDADGLAASEDIEITVTDANEAPKLVYSRLYVSEDAANGDNVGLPIKVWDQDAVDSTLFAITDSNATGIFDIDSATGQVSVLNNLDPLFVYPANFWIAVSVRDKGSLYSVEVFDISLVDENHAPVLADGLAATVVENCPLGTAVATLSAFDEDGDDLFYAVSGTSLFAIDDAASGVITTSSADIDHEAAAEHALEVEVADEFGLADSATLTVTVTDVNEAPVFDDLSRDVAENSPVGSSTLVGDPVLASDVDDGTTLSYSLTSGATSVVSIDSATAQLTLAEAVDFETQSVYTVGAQVSDGSLTDDATLTINVVDVNEAPLVFAAQLNVSEDASVGHTLGTVASYDDDGDALLFFIAGGNADGLFAINPVTTVISLATTVGLDFENAPSYDLVVRAEDPDGLSGNATIHIDVIDVNDLTVSAISGATVMQTDGGEVVTITGTNFGPTDGAAVAVSATYGPYSAVNCDVSVPNTAIECETVAGVGETAVGSYTWTITVGEWTLESAVAATSYAAPSISLVEGADALLTEGGEGITVTGANFGPLGSSVALTHATACAVTVAHTEIQCTSVPGYGGAMSFVVYVNGVASEATDAVYSYIAPVISAVSAPVLETVGGQLVTIDGANFGPSDSPVAAFYGPDDAYQAAACANGGYSRVVCTSAVGVGAGHAWVVWVGDLSSAASGDLTSYKAPNVTAVSGTGASEANTVGGQQVLLAGTNFGPQGSTVRALYGYASEGATEYEAVECDVAVDHVLVKCLTAPGTGKGHAWQVLDVDDQASAVLDAGTSYATPVINALSGVGSGDAVTQGGQNVTISGANFGFSSGKIEEVRYTTTTNLSFVASDCEITVAHVEIVCWTVGGGGYDFSWDATIDGQLSTAPVTDYANPEVLALSGVGATAANTDGGDVVTIAGVNFGLDWLLESVVYGPATDPARFVGDCATTSEHYQIECVTAPGYGTQLAWTVTVAGLANAAETQTVFSAYAPPSIAGVDVTSGPTNGGTVITITGDNFGPLGLATVWFNGGEDVVTPERQPSSGVLVVESPERQGVGKPIQVQVAGEQISDVGEGWAFSYTAPYIDEIAIARWGNSTAWGSPILLELLGSNFGNHPDVSGPGWVADIRVNGASVNGSNVVEWTHEVVKIVYQNGGGGTVEIEVEGQLSNSKSFVYFSPELQPNYCADDACHYYSYRPNSGDAFTPGLALDTDGGTLRLQALYMGSEPTVTIGDAECVNTEAFSQVDGAEYPWPLADGETYEIECAVGDVQGTDLRIVVYNGDLVSDPTDLVLQTQPPTITAWAGNGDDDDDDEFVVSTPTTGQVLTLEGANLGTFGAVYVDGVEAEVSDHSHTEITLTVPAGEGAGLVISVNISSQFDSTTFSYQAPDVGLVEVLSATGLARTAGGEELRITGLNFGDASLSDEHEVTVADLPCEITELSHTEIVCLSPAAQGASVAVQVTVRGQVNVASADARVDYHPPQAWGMTPAGGSTAGGYSVALFGDNFGQRTYPTVDAVPWVLRFAPGEAYGAEDTLIVGNASIVAWNHTYVEFTMPEGQGHAKSLYLRVSDQTLADEDAELYFEFDPPTVSALVQPSFVMGEFGSLWPQDSTLGGFAITLVGESFGVKNGEVTIDGKTCSIQSQTHDELVCLVPQHFGSDLPLDLFVDDRQSPTAMTFTYAEPDVASTQPSPYDNVDGEELVISGTGFGQTRQDNNVSVWIHGKPCLNSGGEWLNYLSGDIVAPFVLCEPEPDVVGKRNLTIRVAGQTVHLPLELTAACPPDFEGQVGETCEACPEDEGAVCSGEAADVIDVHYWKAEEADFDSFANDRCSTDPCDAEALAACLADVDVAGDLCGSGFVECHNSTRCESQIDDATRAELCRDCSYCVNDDADAWPYSADEELLACRYKYEEPVSDWGWFMFYSETPDTRCHANRDHRAECQVFLPCEPNEACLGANECAVEYTGFRCAECSYDHFRLEGECVPCPDCEWCIPVAFASVLIVAGSISYILKKKKVNVGILSIGVDYFQVLALFAKSDVQWPSALKTLFTYLSAFNFNIELTAPECLMSSVEYTYIDKWTVIELFPLLVGALFLGLHWFIWAKKKFLLRKRINLHSHSHLIISAVLLSSYYLYLFITRTTLDVFNCHETTPPDGFTYMEAVFERCYEPGGVHMTLLPWAVLSFIFFSLGFPAVVGAILWRGRAKIIEDQLLRCEDTGDDLASNPNFAFRQRFSNLYSNFKPTHYGWMLVILWRKFSISVSSLLFSNVVFQMAVSLLVIFISYSLQVKNNPYMSMSERANVLEEFHKKMAEQAEQEDYVMPHQRRAVGHQNKHGKKNLKFGAALAKRDKSELRQATAAYMFNYNTVEATLLFSAVLVNLGGIMLGSGGLDGGTSTADRDALTVMLIMVIVYSIGYFMFVLFAELVTALFPHWHLFQGAKDKYDEEQRKRALQIDESDIEFVSRDGAAGGGEKLMGSMEKLKHDNQQLVMTIQGLQHELAGFKKTSQTDSLRGFTGGPRKQKKKKKEYGQTTSMEMAPMGAGSSADEVSFHNPMHGSR